MAKSKQTEGMKTSSISNHYPGVEFGKMNYILMGAGIVLVLIGFLMMIGGKSANANEFHPEELYSATRITIAPGFVLLGFIVEIVAIMYRPKNENGTNQ
jgi:predicted tellurium resistance membrane protein TerC